MAKTSKLKKSGVQRFSKKSLTSALVVIAMVALIGGYWTIKSSHADTPLVKICNVQSSSANQCLVTNGPGALVWADSDFHTATWTQIQIGVGAQTSYEFQNASGHCLTLQTAYNKSGSHYVVMSQDACAPSNANERWTVSQTSPFTITNLVYGCNLHVPTTSVVVDCAYQTSGSPGTGWIYKAVVN